MRAAYWFFAAHLILAIVLDAALIFKVNHFGITDFLRHFTNWFLTYLTVFFNATLGFAFRRTAWTAAIVVATMYLPLVSLAASVAAMVAVMLIDNPHFLTKMFKIFPTGYVITGNELVHFFPLVLILAFTVVHRNLVFYAHHVPLRWARKSRALQALLFAYWTLAALLTMILPYDIAYDPSEVYGVELVYGPGIIVYLTIALLLIVTPLLLGMLYYGLGTINVDYRRLYLTDYEIKVIEEKEKSF